MENGKEYINQFGVYPDPFDFDENLSKLIPAWMDTPIGTELVVKREFIGFVVYIGRRGGASVNRMIIPFTNVKIDIMTSIGSGYIEGNAFLSIPCRTLVERLDSP